MANRQIDSGTMPQPGRYVTRMILFVAIVGAVAFALRLQLMAAFFANPVLNGVILGVLLIGILHNLGQVTRLWPEVRWVNAFRRADPSLSPPSLPQTRLLAPMAMMLADRKGPMLLTASGTRAILESVSARLDESRDISRYLVGLMVFLGLLGTFWGLMLTVSSVGDTIRTLSPTGGEAASAFEDLRRGLEAPLSGMGTAFSSSLFGLAGSLILGFLDLQASQGQNRFYNKLEEWLSTVTSIGGPEGEYGNGAMTAQEMGDLVGDLRIEIRQLARAIEDLAAGRGR